MAHLYFVSQTGTGKTTLLQNLNWQDLKLGHGLAFLDPHGAAVEDLVRRLPAERRADVVYRDLTDSNLGRRLSGRQSFHLFAGLTLCECGAKMYVPSDTPKTVSAGEIETHTVWDPQFGER